MEKPNKQNTLLGLAKMGLRTNRREVFDLAVKRGLDIDYNFGKLEHYCRYEILNFKSLEWLYKKEQDYIIRIDKVTHIDTLSSFKSDTLDGLSPLKNLESLYCHGIGLKSLKILKHFPKLKQLRCAGNNITNLEGIEHCTNLEDIRLDINNITDLTPLSGLTKITDLNIEGNNIKTLKPLKSLHDLEYLNYDENPLQEDEQYFLELRTNQIIVELNSETRVLDGIRFKYSAFKSGDGDGLKGANKQILFYLLEAYDMGEPEDNVGEEYNRWFKRFYKPWVDNYVIPWVESNGWYLWSY